MFSLHVYSFTRAVIGDVRIEGPLRCGFLARSYLCPYKWRIYKGAFYNALRESRRCKESCRMRWRGEGGLIILSRTISCQPRAGTLATVVVLRTLVSTPSQPYQSNALTHTRARVRDGVGQRDRFRRVCVRHCIWLQARLWTR